MYKKFKTFKGGELASGRPSDTLPHATKNLPSEKLFYFQNLNKIPPKPILLIAFLATIGLLNMYSISVSINETYFIKFIFFWCLAMVPFFASVVVNIRYLIKFAYILYGVAIVGLLAVFVVGSATMGATRWIDIGFMKVQPSEFAKIAIIIALARYYHFSKDFDFTKIRFIACAAIICTIPAGLTIIQPDLGSGLIIIFLMLLIVFINGVAWRWIVIALLGVLCILPVVWSQLHSYQKNRIIIFLEPEKDPYGAGYNVIQSKIAIGSGGFFGKGYLNNDQSSLKFLPENQTDFALTVFAEEFGFFGCFILLCIFANLIMYGLMVSMKARSHFCRILAFGITCLMFLHIIINMAMVMGLLPVVGIPLPFISYGGSALMICVVCIGLLINIDIHKDLTIQANIHTYMLK